MKSEQARAAAMIRKHLKAQGIKARVRSASGSMTSSVNIDLQGDYLPAVVDAVKAYCNQYQMGHFDGMTDMYEYSSVNGDIPQVKFVFVSCNYSDEIKQECWDYVRSHWGDMEDAPESYEDAWKFNCRNGNGRDLFHREFSGRDKRGFWFQKKERVAA